MVGGWPRGRAQASCILIAGGFLLFGVPQLDCLLKGVDDDGRQQDSKQDNLQPLGKDAVEHNTCNTPLRNSGVAGLDVQRLVCSISALLGTR